MQHNRGVGYSSVDNGRCPSPPALSGGGLLRLAAMLIGSISVIVSLSSAVRDVLIQSWEFVSVCRDTLTRVSTSFPNPTQQNGSSPCAASLEAFRISSALQPSWTRCRWSGCRPWNFCKRKCLCGVSVSFSELSSGVWKHEQPHNTSQVPERGLHPADPAGERVSVRLPGQEMHREFIINNYMIVPVLAVLSANFLIIK